jgi:serine/threonine-protein kinase
MLDPTFNPVEERPPWLATSSRRIGRYVLGPSLGRGGMGEVFAAWDTFLGRLVALKLILGGGATALLRFMQEARLQARVDHPNVCRVLDVDIEGDQPFISMQIVKGPSLSQVQLEQREILAVMRQVADAVHAAHRLNLIHRDLKPGNILLERNAAEGWTPFVCDFGLAKDLGADSLEVSQAGAGTPAFMSPEQLFLNGAEVHVASDVYGLGATLLQALAGNLPQRGGTAEEGLAVPDDLPKDLQAILRRCLAWDPQDRYPTAAALAEDLRRYLDGSPSPTPTPAGSGTGASPCGARRRCGP